jgi:nucleoid-associated protein YgaU
MVNLQVLQTKYQPAIDLGKARGVSWKNIHIENEKLLIRGAAPNEGIKNDVWNAIKTIDAGYGDLTADITIDASLPAPAVPAAAAQPRVYEVVSGDTLSKIAKHFYGDAAKYPKIFEANRDQLKDPNVIKPGQKLKIPE